jgi:hypothetical protein
LITNKEFLSQQICDVAAKMEIEAQDQHKKQKAGKKAIENDALQQIVSASSKTALELNHGMMVEILKKFMFTAPEERKEEAKVSNMMEA